MRATLNYLQFGMQAFITDLRRLEGDALLTLGRLAEAEQVLLEAHAQAAAQPSYRTLWTISAALCKNAGRSRPITAAGTSPKLDRTE